MAETAKVLGSWAVESNTRPEHFHRIEVVAGGRFSCTCEAGKYGIACWHIRHIEELFIQSSAPRIREVRILPAMERAAYCRTMVIMDDDTRVYLRAHSSQVFRHMIRRDIAQGDTLVEIVQQYIEGDLS